MRSVDYERGYAQGHADALAEWPSPPPPRDEKLRRLDDAEALGEAAYAIERRRQGLVEYDRHRGL